MKTSEQMTADVLKRRDEELKALPKKRRIKMAAIGTPCMAAAAALGIVSFNFVHGANEFLGTYEGATLEDYTYTFFHGGKGKYANTLINNPNNAENHTELGVLQVGSIDIAYEDRINENPNAGKYAYRLMAQENVSDIIALEKPAPYIEPTDFIQQTVKLMNMSYGIEFDRFGRLHPDWTETHEPFGYYIRVENDGFATSMRVLSDQNTLNYVTPDGAEISVTAQRYQKFFDDKKMPALNQADNGNNAAGETGHRSPIRDENDNIIGYTAPSFLIDQLITHEYDENGNLAGARMDGSINKPDNKSYNMYDEDGNVIGAFTPGYDPGNTGAAADNKTNDIVVTNVFTNSDNSDTKEYLAYLDMGHTWVRIRIKGIPSYEYIKELLDEYTADRSWLDDINSLNNPYHGKYSFKFISGQSDLLSSINGVEGYPNDHELSKPEYTFWDHSVDDLSQQYRFDFDRLGRLHPDWSKTIDRPLGFYSREEDPDVDSFTIVSDYNTLGYTTPDGAKITVTAQTKPFYPSNEILEDVVIGNGPFIILDEDGSKIEEIEFGFTPHYNVIVPEGTEQLEIEIYSDRTEPDTHLAYINMGSWVKIRAEGLSDKEFLELLKEFIK